MTLDYTLFGNGRGLLRTREPSPVTATVLLRFAGGEAKSLTLENGGGSRRFYPDEGVFHIPSSAFMEGVNRLTVIALREGKTETYYPESLLREGDSLFPEGFSCASEILSLLDRAEEQSKRQRAMMIRLQALESLCHGYRLFP